MRKLTAHLPVQVALQSDKALANARDTGLANCRRPFVWPARGDAGQPPWMALSTRVGIEEAAYHDRSGLNADSSAAPHAHARARSKISLARRALTRILTLPPAATADPKGSQSPLYAHRA